MLIAEARQRLDMLPPGLREKNVFELFDSFQPVKTVRETETAINAFKRMQNENIHGLAVVDGRVDCMPFCMNLLL